MLIEASEFLKKLVAEEVRRQLSEIRASARAYKPVQDTTSTCTVSWSGGAVAWPQSEVKRNMEKVSGRLDPREVDELVMSFKFKSK